MHHRHRTQTDQSAVVDLTYSDNESLGLEPALSPLLVLPEPTNPTRPRRLTARECLRSDQIAHGETDVHSPKGVFAQESSLHSDEEVLDLTQEVSPSELNVPHAELSSSSPYHESFVADIDLVTRAISCVNETVKTLEGSANANYIEDESPALPVQQPQCDTSPIVVSSSSEAGDSSDDELVLYGEKHIIDLTKLDDEPEDGPEVIETMANCRPRRSCAPKSFETLTETKGNNLSKMVKRVIAASMVELTDEERAYADRYRDNIVKTSVAAHHALFKNKLVHKFSYNCGRIDVGPARAALVHIGQLFGAYSIVVKKNESGRCVRYVVMEAGKRLCSPMELDIREVANKLIDRAFKAVKEKTKSKGVNKSGQDVSRISRTEQWPETEQKKRKKKKGQTAKHVQLEESMVGLTQDVGKAQDVVNRVVPIQEEKQRENAREEAVAEHEGVTARSLGWNRNMTWREQIRPSIVLQTSNIQNTDRGNGRKRKPPFQEDTMQSKERRRMAWEQKRRRKFDGTKIETDNKGFAMLAKMGWREGQRLGAKRNGLSEPIVADFRSGRRGLGTKK